MSEASLSNFLVKTVKLSIKLMEKKEKQKKTVMTPRHRLWSSSAGTDQPRGVF